MKITGTKSYVDIEINGRTARFGGDLGIDGFYASIKTMRWLPPHDQLTVTTEERNALIEAVLKESEGRDFKIFFV